MPAENTRPAPARSEHATGKLAGNHVNRVGYGAMQLAEADHLSGGRQQAVNLLRRAVELGVNYIDTAQFYGQQAHSDGLVNELIREALRPYPENLKLVSKVGAVYSETGEIPLAPAQQPAELRISVEANLRSLDSEQLAVVNLRRLDGGGPGIQATGDQVVDLDSQLAELVALRDEGKVGAIGLSNVGVDQVRHALPAGIACVQNSYNVLDRAAEPVLAECREHDIAWVPFFPLGSAAFPGMPSVTAHPAVVDAAGTLDASPAQVGLAWLLEHDPRALLIPGTTNPDHLTQNMAAADLRLGPDLMATLDALATQDAEGTFI